ncbi:hypothetical protein IAD21_04506 [Abditibacteriota bacterium]|nr:hypothetical protein IAD21_04506 [Abditibacteriota bacterium]
MPLCSELRGDGLAVRVYIAREVVRPPEGTFMASFVNTSVRYVSLLPTLAL